MITRNVQPFDPTAALSQLACHRQALAKVLRVAQQRHGQGFTQPARRELAELLAKVEAIAEDAL